MARQNTNRSDKMVSLEKRNKGQFFTTTNPFNLNPFFEWYNKIPNIEEEIVLEPFGGSNNIIEMIESINLEHPKGWDSYDIQPPEINKTPEYKVVQQDTLANFPKGYRVAITNPPYLAKNSATRRGLDFPDSIYDDMYKESLQQMLDNLDYVAAIIPESYINAGLFEERLDKVISLNVKMFEDTEVPVCLALFVPQAEKIGETEVYRMDLLLGTIDDLREELSIIQGGDTEVSKLWRFNDPQGTIGVQLVDNTVKDSINFFPGELIDSSKIKPTSRASTRISGINFKDEDERLAFIEIANSLLYSYREKTEDVFMTSFKGLRKDGRYRRRLDFKTVRSLLTKSYEILKEGESNVKRS